MNNFDTARAATETAMNSEDSAMREQETYLSSLEAKIQQFQAAFQSLSNTSINSDFLKGLVDTGTGLLTVLDEIIDKTGILTPLIGTIGGIFAQKTGLGKRNAALYKVKQNYRRFINVENFIASNMNKPYSYNY